MPALASGTRLGPYEIVAPLGAGGMGEVYRAHDTRLARDVAVKALPEGFALDPERLARFEREAKLLASLSHANIAGIHGVEEVAGQRYLILEFVDGETLADRLLRGALPIDDAIEICSGVALALEAAHEAGIVHRDLKPANVMLTAAGAVKVLDFGLAKNATAAHSGSSADLSASPTMTYAATVAGVVLGTAAYMSPEQARGRTVDRRTDIWSFGCLLYECLTARKLFTGETISDLVAHILKGEPDWSALPAATPRGVRRVLVRCLHKDARERLRDIGDARLELAEVDDAPPGPTQTSARAPSRFLFAALGVALAATVAVLAWVTLQPRRERSGITEASMMLPYGQRLARISQNHIMAISPDGRSIAFKARSGGSIQLHVRRLDGRGTLVVPDTPDARDPFFSPDGEWLAFFDSQQLLKVSVRGGAPIHVADSQQERGGIWLDDGSIVFCPDAIRPVFRIPPTGGVPVAITKLDTVRQERSHRWPDALSGGPWVVFTVGLMNSPGDYDGSDIDAVNVRTGERRNLIHGARRAMWVAPEHLVFNRKGTLFAVKIDPRNPRVSSEPVPVLEDVSGERSSGASHMSVAREGSMAWIPSDDSDVSREIGWFDRAGRWSATPVPPGEYRKSAVSPDGGSALIVRGAGSGAGDVWLADLRTGGLRRLTYTDKSNTVVWLPDASGFAYGTIDSTLGSVLAARRIDAAGGTRIICKLSGNGLISDISSDGRLALTSDWGPADGRMFSVALAGDGAAAMLTTDATKDAYEMAGVFSEDCQWIAYVSNRTGREEVFVRRRDGASGQWQVSTHGGGGVRWGRGDRELFFVEDEILKSVTIATNGNDLALGQATSLFEVPSAPGEQTLRDYSYDPRTDRFLFTRPPSGSDEAREIALSIGWGARLAGLISKRGENP